MAGWIELCVTALAIASPSTPPSEGNCVKCHAGQLIPRFSIPTASVAASVHRSLEHPCVACHGGDPREPTLRAHDASRGFKGRPAPKDIPWVCGGCHSDAAYIRRFSASLSVDQLALFRVSEHGRALERGEIRAATCVSCHGYHDVRRVSDAKSPMHALHVADTCATCHSDREHPAHRHSKNSPRSRWLKGVHAKALLEDGDSSAPTCNDCHGDHGAAPPGVSDIHNACGTCHAQQSDLFQRSPHSSAYKKLGFGECAECHGRHDVRPASDAMLGDGESAVCVRCHKKGDKGLVRAKLLREKVDKANAVALNAFARLEDARRVGLLVPEAELERTALVTAARKLRISVHSLEAEAMEVDFAAVEASAVKIVNAVTAAEEELHVVRRGYVVFIVFLFGMTVLLWLKLRRLSK
jgi:predicted CXXCH cytochrome family protein